MLSARFIIHRHGCYMLGGHGPKVCVMMGLDCVLKIQISKDHILTQSRGCMWLLEENGDIYFDSNKFS